MKMKKIISMFRVGFTAVSLLAGCSSDSGSSSGDASDETTQSVDQGEDAEAYCENQISELQIRRNNKSKEAEVRGDTGQNSAATNSPHVQRKAEQFRDFFQAFLFPGF